MRIVILAPIPSSLYARVVTRMAYETPGVTVVGVAIRTPWSLKRARSEFRRDGARLLKKAFRQFVLRKRAFDPTTHEHLLGLAKEHGLQARTLNQLCRANHTPCRTFADHNDEDCLSFLKELNPDVIAFTGGGLIRSELLRIPSKGIVNCHMGPLPRFRGLDVVEYPVLERRLDDEGTGLTLHYMDSGIDTGPILLRRSVLPRAGESFATLRHRMKRAMAELMLEGLRGIRDEAVKPKYQDPESGRQYYVMHPRIAALATRELARHNELVSTKTASTDRRAAA